MVRPLGSMHGPEEPQHSGFDPNDPAETTRPHGTTPPHETQEAQAAETPNGAAHHVISALAGDPLGASPAQAASKGGTHGIVPRTISDTVIHTPKNPGVLELLNDPKNKFSPEEVAIAKKLAEEGYNVKQLPRRDSKTADVLLSGNEIKGFRKVEFKSMDPGAKIKTPKNEVSNSLKRGGQARDMILDARVSGLSKEDAIEGIKKIIPLTRPDGPVKLDSVRIMGDGYDLTAKFHQR